MKGMKFTVYYLIVFLWANTLFAQEFTQTIKGRIIDQQSKSPLVGVNIILLDSKPFQGSTTDTEGFFKIPNVALGRNILKISYMGYKEQVIPNVLVTSGKEVILNLEMEEQVTNIQEVTVTAIAHRNNIDRGLVTVSGKSFDIEDTRRFAGSRNDPARMVAGFAGVTSSNDSRNDIIIRGNTPSGVLWRLDGVDIPNPNHFGSLGSTGGPVSMLNNNQLGKSAFLTGAFPAIYGNATAGVFDLQMRNGNNEKHEFMCQVGFNGVEVGAEGPFSKNAKASYLINYRYSILDLIKKLGVNFGTGAAVPVYQDLSVKINIPTERLGTFSIFGLGGKSKIKFSDEQNENFYSGDGESLDYQTSMGLIGLSNTYFFNSKTSGKATISWTGSTESALQDDVLKDKNGAVTIRPDYRNNSFQNRLAFSYVLNKKLNAKNSFLAGFTYNQLNLNYIDSTRTEGSKFITLRNFKGNAGFVQGYGNWQTRLSDKLTINAGIYYQQLLLNNTFAIEPRAGLRYNISKNQSVSFGIGRNSQLQVLQLYFNNKAENGTYSETNRNLDMTRSDQIVLGYERNLGAKTRLKLETYYQNLSNIPVDKKPSNYSVLNIGADFGTNDKTDLQNTGTGRNFGAEMTVERTFSNGYYYLATVSVFDSKYKGSNGIEHNTAFNGNYTINLLAGKEFQVSKKMVLSFDTKITSAGGKRFTPIDFEASKKAQIVVRFTDRYYESQYKDYFRVDFKITLRRNGKNVMQEWFVDLQNVSNAENIFEQTYKPATDKLTTTYQLGFFPNFNYRIQF
jgi:CarboxypepD_reg-like domain/TonB-dependent Receptor Plug Domain